MSLTATSYLCWHVPVTLLPLCMVSALQMYAIHRSLCHVSAGALTLLVLIITSGYAIVKGSIPGWWIWAYWISPFAYALRSVVINDLRAPSWGAPANPANPTGLTVGQQSLQSFDFFTERYW